MVSRNQLLGSGIVNEEVEVSVASTRVPTARYHETCPGGKTVKTEAELDKLDAAGWKDHPGKVQLLPGHEAIWKAEQELQKAVNDSISEPSGIETEKEI
jgi:hypothetical protein